jgi:hypothetical protein
MTKLIRLVASLIIIAVFCIGCNESSQSSIAFDLTAGARSVETSGSTTISCSVQNPGGEEFTYAWEVTGGTISGEGATITWIAPTAAGAYTIRATVSDSQGGNRTKEVTVEVISTSNSPPTVEGVITAPSNDIYDDETATLTCVAADPDGDAISSYTWEAAGGAISGKGAAVTWTPPRVSGTNLLTLSVSITDGKGNQSSAFSIPITVREASSRNSSPAGPNHSPVIEAVTVQWSQIERGKTGLIKCIAHDPDGDKLTYKWEIERGSITGEGPLIKYTAPWSYVDVTINVIVSDGRGDMVAGGARFSVVCCGYAHRNPEWTG